MNVHKWLKEVVQPEKPLSLPDQLGLPQFPRAKLDREDPAAPAGASASTHKQRRKNKPAGSDSSILPAPKRISQNDYPQHEVLVYSGANRAPSPADRRSDHSSSVSRASDHRYERRPRNKPRPDLYEPKGEASKARGSRKHKRSKDESRQEKRKTRPSKTDNPGVGLVQSFHANNVPRERLTLKPREKLGIFNKGRASTPVKGRGLPDLVFSEMKFLQKRKVAPEDVQKEEDTRKRRKKDHAHASEHEMSAYFTSLRPALAERDTNIQSEQPPAHHNRSLALKTDHKQQPSASVESPIPTVEFPEKPYLGFGSRGARHESGYLSWSETDQFTTQSPEFRRALTAIDIGQLESAHHLHKSTNIANKSPMQPLSSLKSLNDPPTGDRYGRVRVSSSLPISFTTTTPHLVGPRPRSDPQKRRRLSRQSTTVPASFPEEAAVWRHEERKKVTHQEIAETCSDSRPTNKENREVTRSYQRMQTSIQGLSPTIKTDPDPDTSSTLDKLLRDCESAAAWKDPWPDRQQNTDRRPTVQFTLADEGARGSEDGVDEAQQPDVTPQPVFTSQIRLINSEGFPSLFDEQAQQDRQNRKMEMYADDADMGEIQSVLRADRQREGYDDGLSYLPDGMSFTGRSHSHPISSPEGDAVGGGQRPTGQRGEDIFASFWRPHKLY